MARFAKLFALVSVGATVVFADPAVATRSALQMQRRLEADGPVLSPRHGQGPRSADFWNGARAQIAASPIGRWRSLRRRRHQVLDQGAERHPDDEGRQGNLLDTMAAQGNLGSEQGFDGLVSPTA
jgi:hypothetical protein